MVPDGAPCVKMVIGLKGAWSLDPWSAHDVLTIIGFVNNSGDLIDIIRFLLV